MRVRKSPWGGKTGVSLRQAVDCGRCRSLGYKPLGVGNWTKSKRRRITGPSGLCLSMSAMMRASSSRMISSSRLAADDPSIRRNMGMMVAQPRQWRAGERNQRYFVCVRARPPAWSAATIAPSPRWSPVRSRRTWSSVSANVSPRSLSTGVRCVVVRSRLLPIGDEVHEPTFTSVLASGASCWRRSAEGDRRSGL